MPRPSLMLVFFAVALCSSCTGSNAGGATDEFLQAKCLKVPAAEFIGSIRTTIDAIRTATAVVSRFGGLFRDFHSSNAVSDCLDLLDLSADELTWAMSAAQNPNAKDNGTGDLSSDLRTWLSAAMANQDTCIDGLQGTSGIAKHIVAGSLNTITSLVRDLLTVVHPGRSSRSNGIGKGDGGNGSGSHSNHKVSNKNRVPYWFKREDRNLLQVNGVTPNVVVATDGTGDFTSIRDAVAAAPDESLSRYVVYIKKGVYKENVEIKKKKWNIMLVGDGMDVTVISGKRSFIGGWTTYRSATFSVSGRGFIARDLTFENTAGPEKHQAVALRSDSDLSVFFQCAIRGYQDTLYTHAMRQFFRECTITGTVDFIFGDGTVVFQNCLILAKKGLPNQTNTITAQGRKDPNQPSGFSIQFCNISADTDLSPSVNSTPTYLGRPWKLYSRTIIMQSYIGDAIRPQGWLEWNQDFALDTLYYAEYKNSGPGSSVGGRIQWPGYHVLNNSAQAVNFTVAQFIEGNLWLPLTGVKYTSGLKV